ncbi:putative nf-x1 finger and helicase domain protein [Eutypa lata UCREL1]|uniref:Putative nf-x1 finger and helicase domain protein n=1 Tax=Eutypa lata (strain UCR-EL1) TaxID=1287681 RepID=M7SH75_EUTLA|nr:putative nf-x1 finger and helicase domain protein [Eutypa lata UCREL1]
MKRHDGSSLRGKNNGVRTHVYEDAEIADISFNKIRGMDLLVRIRQAANAKEVQKRHDWWAHSKRFQPGALVCLVSECGSVLFCVVADETIITSGNSGREQQSGPSKPQKAEQEGKPSLANDPVYSYIHLHVAEVESDNVFQALRWYRDVGPFKRRCVVEFPGVLLPSFKYTLEALQGMSKRLDLPFT